MKIISPIYWCYNLCHQVLQTSFYLQANKYSVLINESEKNMPFSLMQKHKTTKQDISNRNINLKACVSVFPINKSMIYFLLKYSFCHWQSFSWYICLCFPTVFVARILYRAYVADIANHLMMSNVSQCSIYRLKSAINIFVASFSNDWKLTTLNYDKKTSFHSKCDIWYKICTISFTGFACTNHVTLHFVKGSI